MSAMSPPWLTFDGRLDLPRLYESTLQEHEADGPPPLDLWTAAFTKGFERFVNVPIDPSGLQAIEDLAVDVMRELATGRPEWEQCIASSPRPHAPGLCGFAGRVFFVDKEHARRAVEQGSRLVPCPGCMATPDGEPR